MDQIKRFKRLTAAARREQPPAIEVSDRVIGTIRSRLLVGGMSRPLWVMAAVSAAAAAVVAFAAIVGTGSTPTADPWNDLFGPLTMVIK